MDKKIHSVMMLTLMLIGILTSAFSIQTVRGEPKTWYVDDDGPADFYMIQSAVNVAADGDTIYVYEGTYYEHVVVDKSVSLVGEERSTTIIDGNETGTVVRITQDDVSVQNFTIRGSGRFSPYPVNAGIYISFLHNCSITDNNITENNHWGILVEYSSEVTIARNSIIGNNEEGLLFRQVSHSNVTANSIANNEYGIRAEISSNNRIAGNNITGSYFAGLSMHDCINNNVSANMFINDGMWVSGPHENIVVGNTVNGKPIVYLEGVSGHKVDDDAGQVLLLRCTDMTVESLNLSNTFVGLILCETKSSRVIKNNVASNKWGIDLFESSNNNTISENNITDNWASGIYPHFSSNNTITGNHIANNRYGVYFISSLDNSIYHNNFINNTRHAYFYGPELEPNSFDDGYPSGGNYWSDYEERYPDATEIDGSGIWDTPYVIDAYNQDNYPLMEPYSLLPRTIDELKTAIEESGCEGKIDNQGIVKSLLAKLDVAQKMVDKGKIDQTKNILNAFINEVQAQSGKHITPEAAEILIQSAEYLISHL